MSYKINAGLPASLRNVLPDHGQSIYKEAFNHAFQEDKDPQTRASPTDSEKEPIPKKRRGIK